MRHGGSSKDIFRSAVKGAFIGAIGGAWSQWWRDGDGGGEWGEGKEFTRAGGQGAWIVAQVFAPRNLGRAGGVLPPKANGEQRHQVSRRQNLFYFQTGRVRESKEATWTSKSMIA